LDNLTRLERSKTMRAVRSVHTSPELLVRRIVFSLGYRYRLHDRRLPGCPDLLFPSRKKAIFVHGCFWHRHSCPAGRKRPKTNIPYWSSKLAGNKRRDLRNLVRMQALGWRTLVLWECELKEPLAVGRRIVRFLD
jgi:DNA mismatch endonuclease (patch repair protein)